jgi:2'-5' RNA ligase
VNVRADELPQALAVLREAAWGTTPFTVRLGPPSTFLPATPTLHLAVGGRGPATSVLRQLRDAVFRAPLERPLTHSFVPHVTLAEEMEPDRIAAALPALSDYVVEARFERLHLLQEVRSDAGRRWEPIADAPFAPRIVVGRGGVELELAVSRLLDPEAARAEASWSDEGVVAPVVPSTDPSGHGSTDATPEVGPAARDLVVVARRRGEVVGVARGLASSGAPDPTWVVVAPEQRRQGVARQLVAAFRHAATPL